MDYMFPSRNDENLLLLTSDKFANNHGNINLRQQQEEQPLFLHFLSPFLDNMDTTTTILPNLDDHRISTAKLTTNSSIPCLKPKSCIRKTKGAGKKDRHSKIHTAQGLRDRRMRLSVHTARKFFDLNDMLGFDKASKTIEWLFAQSQKAIEEVTTETLQSDDATTQTAVSKENYNECESPLSLCETESVMEITASTDIDDNLELHQTQPSVGQFSDIGDETSRKTIKSYPSVKEYSVRNEARSRSSRERARDDTIMINNLLEKPKQLFQYADPPAASVDFNQSQELGFSKNLDNNPHMEESSACYPLEYSNTYHFLKHLHLDNPAKKNTDATNYLGNITSLSSTSCSVFDYNKTLDAEPVAGWLNPRNTFLGFLGGWDTATNSRLESNHNGMSSNIAPSNGNMNGENPTSGIISSGFSDFHSQGQ